MRRIKFRLPSPAMVVALVALSVAMGGTGYAANDLIHTAAKHHKGGKTTPLTKQQILVLIKRYTPKAINGLNGQNGSPGAPGSPGSVVLTRARATGATQSSTATSTTGTAGCIYFTPNVCPDSSHGAVVPLSGGSWTQPANQVDQFFGQVAYTPPAAGTCTFMASLGGPSSTYQGLLAGEVDDAASGTPIATFSGFQTGGGGGGPQTTGTLSAPSLFEPGSSLGHALTVKIADNCGANGGTGTSHYTLNSFALDPVGVS
jgi:hypothetical protein